MNREQQKDVPRSVEEASFDVSARIVYEKSRNWRLTVERFISNIHKTYEIRIKSMKRPYTWSWRLPFIVETIFQTKNPPDHKKVYVFR